MCGTQLFCVSLQHTASTSDLGARYSTLFLENWPTTMPRFNGTQCIPNIPMLVHKYSPQVFTVCSGPGNQPPTHQAGCRKPGQDWARYTAVHGFDISTFARCPVSVMQLGNGDPGRMLDIKALAMFKQQLANLRMLPLRSVG